MNWVDAFVIIASMIAIVLNLIVMANRRSGQ